MKNKKDYDFSNEPDDFAPYVEPFDDDPIYDLRKLLKYCEEKGVEPKDLSDKEINQFIVGKYKDFN